MCQMWISRGLLHHCIITCLYSQRLKAAWQYWWYFSGKSIDWKRVHQNTTTNSSSNILQNNFQVIAKSTKDQDNNFNINSFASLYKATPIYLLVLRAQEVGNEPFWNKKKSWKMWLFFSFFFFRVCRLGLVAISFYQPILNYIKSINQLIPVTWRVGGIPPQVWGSTTARIASCSWLNHPYKEYS